MLVIVPGAPGQDASPAGSDAGVRHPGAAIPFSGPAGLHCRKL